MYAVGCELNGVLYQNGQTFQPSPFYTCLCIGDIIGCSPLLNSKQDGSQCTESTVVTKKKSDLSNCALEKNAAMTENKLIPGIQHYLVFFVHCKAFLYKSTQPVNLK